MNKRILSSYGGEIEPAIVISHMENGNRKDISDMLEGVKLRRNIDYIAIHCSATKEGADFSSVDIDKWHKNRGFSKIGYHFVIRLDGTIEVGRDLNEIGAHVSGFNQNSIGICYVGGLDKNGRPADTRTERQKESLVWLIKRIVSMLPRKPIILGHKDFPNVNKACPCFDAKEEYRYI